MDVFNNHQARLARATLQLSDAGALIMGSMTKEKARTVLRDNGWPASAVAAYEDKWRVED